MPDPSSFFVGNAPQGASYAAPLIGMALGQQFSQYPQQYFQGRQNQRTLAMQNAFPNGLPTTTDPATGQQTTDINKIIDTGVKYGGVDTAMQVWPQLAGMQFDQRVSDSLAGRPPTSPSFMPSANPTANNPTAAGPANLSPGQRTPPSNVGANNQGADTLRQLATEVAGGREISPLIAGLARQLQIDPDQPLTPQRAQQIKAILGRVALPPQGGQGGNNPQQTGADHGGAPFNPVGGVAGTPGGSPGQTGNVAQNAPQGTPSANIQQRFPQPSTPFADPTLNGLVPQSAIDQGMTATQYRDRLAGLAANRFISPQAKTVLDAKIKQLDEYLAKTGEQAQESSLRAQEPTPEMKNAQDPSVLGFEGKKKAQEGVIAAGQKQYEGINAVATQYESDLKHDYQLMASALDDSKLYTGMGADAVLSYNRLKTLVGGDPSPARLQEMMEKITAKAVLGQINTQRDQLQQAGGSSVRLFKQQIDQVEKSTMRLGNTLAGNRMLTELADRAGKQGVVIAQMARNYLNAGNLTLDRGFDQQVHDYLSKNPMFTPDELSNSALIAPPLARTSQDAVAYAQRFPGQPMRVPEQAARQMGANGPRRDDGTVVITHLSTKGAQSAPQQPQGQ